MGTIYIAASVHQAQRDYEMGDCSAQQRDRAIAAALDRERTAAPWLPPDAESCPWPRDVRTCRCGHKNDAEYGETCEDCGRWLCRRCAPSSHRRGIDRGVLCFKCSCARERTRPITERKGLR